MSEIILRSTLPVPEPKETIRIRPGTMEDIPFIDRLQKKYSKNLAFLPRKALEGKINRNEVLVAESCEGLTGYLIGQDQYLKRSELGIIYHLAVEETKQRGFIGAGLLKAQFERSAYGCKLYCCWCAQDLQANYFYESMGFVPIAYRAGSEKKQRTHLFWQKRIRENDCKTPWWYPHETRGGLMMEERLAFPIPPGVHWSDEMPMILPKDTHPTEAPKRLESESSARSQKQQSITTEKHNRKPLMGLTFAAPKAPEIKKEKPVKQNKTKVKNNPRHVSAARELRDRYLEKVNQNPMCLESAGKYDLTRQIETKTPAHRMLAA